MFSDNKNISITIITINNKLLYISKMKKKSSKNRYFRLMKQADVIFFYLFDSFHLN